MDLIKDSITLNNFFFFAVLILIFAAYRYEYKKVKLPFLILIILFLATSTRILPSKLIAFYEAKTPVFDPSELDKNQIYYIHILGSGYSLDPNLPATSQLSTTTLARLVEGIRISKLLPHFILVSSGYSSFGLESQASVVRRAAIELGIPAQNCEILPTPSNTSEEVSAFVTKFGKTKNVIVVSNAIHLPRALMLYKKCGVNPLGAPTNFKVKKGANDHNGLSFPSLNSVDLMSDYLRERLKYWKDGF
ncbi:YdcF family protein [Flavobacterium ardleyense]|uniref:YdcF family protein n=1 Tax=Flavobacterium ardleyense TaxID=2038737 RepID=UPI00298CB638|nr:ElyC/SanA/YdcF family protein [Flavobacterium ardleyense]